jgi:hypothetical protein
VKAAQQEKEAKILRFIGGNKRGATQTAGNASKRSNMEIGDGNEGEKPTSSNSLNSKSKTVPKWFKKQ